jgi:hypothetical protein
MTEIYPKTKKTKDGLGVSFLRYMWEILLPTLLLTLSEVVLFATRVQSL